MASLKKLFMYGFHDVAQWQQMRLENTVPTLVSLCDKKQMSTHYYGNVLVLYIFPVQFIGKLHLIYETRPF